METNPSIEEMETSADEGSPDKSSSTDPSSQQGSETRAVKKRNSRRASGAWTIHSVVPVQEVDAHSKAIEYGFRFDRSLPHVDGTKKMYRCQRLKFTVPRCGRNMMVFISSDNEGEAIMSLRGQHTCLSAPLHSLSRNALLQMYRSKVPSVQSIPRQSKEIDMPREPLESDVEQSGTAKPQETTPPLEESSKAATNFYKRPRSSGLSYSHHSTVPVDQVDAHVQEIEYGFRCYKKIGGVRSKIRFYTCKRLKLSARPQCERKLHVAYPKDGDEGDAVIRIRGTHTCLDAPADHLTPVSALGSEQKRIRKKP